MPISAKDKEFMEEVAAYFRSTKTPQDSCGSIRDTATKFGINRNKVRKILITMGEIESPITETAIMMQQQGMSIKEIARDLGVSVATVSTALPYEDKVDNTLDPTDHAASVREYRAYEREQLKRQAGRASKKQDKSAAWKGDTMADQSINEKEWQKDIKMSYTEAYHRPHRFTWEDIEKMQKNLEAELAESDDENVTEYIKGLLETLNVMKSGNPDEEQEFKKLMARKRLSGEEKERKEFLEYKTGHFPGALCDRNREALEQIAGDRLPPEPATVIRLHMELYDEFSNGEIDAKTSSIFWKYGKVKYGDSISRDVIVPSDIPLYALHYVIQRAFGWQNSHLHMFELPDEILHDLTNHNASMWSKLVGVLFRSPLMDEDDEFWADDYNGGSFKNWLRKKYTGPYMSQCHGEGIVSCQEDMMELDMEEDYYVLYARAFNPESKKYDGEEYVCDVMSVYDHNGKKRPEPKPWHNDEVPYRVEVVRFAEVPSEGLRFEFDRDPMALLERLPLDSVLAAAMFRLKKDSYLIEHEYVDCQISKTGDEIYQPIEELIRTILEEQIDSPEMQPLPTPVTDVILYSYDFGDNWHVRITASENCADLVESGRITQAELDRANVKCREVYRPVLIARDGEMLVDDVGGIYGFADFLQTINPDLKDMEPEEKEKAKQEKKEYLEWAKGLGWHREKVTDFNLL